MATEVLIRPIVTEKLTAMGEKLNRYGFMVDKRANKLEVKKAVEELYGVTVAAVNTIRYAGKVKTRFTKAGVITGQRNSYKKALITLAVGDNIDFYSNI